MSLTSLEVWKEKAVHKCFPDTRLGQFQYFLRQAVNLLCDVVMTSLNGHLQV